MTLRVRRVVAGDCEAAYACASDPTTRRMSFHTEPISWDEHVAWFRTRSGDRANPYYAVVGDDGAPVAFARFDRAANGDAVVSFVVMPDRRGQGLAAPALALATQAAASEAHLALVRADVKTENTASLRAFRRAGYDHHTPGEHDGTAIVRVRWHAPHRAPPT